MGSADGPARAGSFELGKRILPLPVLFEVRPPKSLEQRKLEAASSMEGWESVSIGIEGRPFDDNPLPGPISSSLHEAMVASSLERWGDLVDKYTAVLDLDEGQGPVPAEVLSSMLFPVLLRDPRSFSRAMCHLKEEDPCHPPIYAPGAADGENLEALLYLGVEILDDLFCDLDAASGRFYTMSGIIPLFHHGRAVDPSQICPCEACKVLSKATSPSQRTELMAAHNRDILSKRFMLARTMLQRGTLREHMMGVLAGKPEWLAAVRTIEGGAWPSLHAHTHTWKPLEKVRVTYRDDLHAPELSLWARRMEEDYVPMDRPVLLMLPCSARKPYSQSRTHQRIRAALAGIKGLKRSVHMVVLTSPLGAVPMELETLYPASQYDIPVTGEWFPEESALMRSIISSILGKGSYKEAICYLDGSGTVFPDALRDGELNGVPFTDVPVGAPSGGGLEGLKEAVSAAVERHGPAPSPNDPVTEDLLSLVRFSLDADLSNVGSLSTRYDRAGPILVSGRKLLVRCKAHGPQPTLLCGKLLWEGGVAGGGRRVEIEDFLPTGTVFSQGVRSVSPSIRPGDTVLVGTGDRFKAVGRAIVPARWMTSGRRGNAVRIIEHVSGV